MLTLLAPARTRPLLQYPVLLFFYYKHYSENITCITILCETKLNHLVHYNSYTPDIKGYILWLLSYAYEGRYLDPLA